MDSYKEEAYCPVCDKITEQQVVDHNSYHLRTCLTCRYSKQKIK